MTKHIQIKRRLKQQRWRRRRFLSIARCLKQLLSAASERRAILIRRFGLGQNSERETLEAIGDRHITRDVSDK